MDAGAKTVVDWLNALNLGRYAGVFDTHHIDLDSLPLLKDADLQELGIPLGPRKILLKAIAGMSGSPQADLRENGERRQLTVMFCDLVGATQLSSQLDPEDLRDVLRAYQQTCAEAIRARGGFIAQYLGDGILAYFGYPLAIETAAERAVAAGLDIVAAVAAVKSPTGATLRARIGVATGLAIVGDIIGEGVSEQAAVIGQVPNLAARIQSLAEPGAVAVAHNTRLLLGEMFTLLELGTHELKGIPGAVQVWGVTGFNAPTSRYDSLRAPSSAELIGRDAECARLSEVWSKARAGAGQAAFIIGEAGIGKSTLLHYLGEQATASGAVRISLQCSDLHAATPLYPLITHLQRAADIKPGDSPEQKLAKIERIADPSARDEEVALLAGLLSVPLTAPYKPLAVPPSQKKAMTLRLAVNQVLRLAATAPVLLTVEDVHWMDPTTGELARAMFENIGAAPVMVLISARPEFVAPWPEPAGATHVVLDKLEGGEIASLIQRVAGSVELPAAAQKMIEERSDGVPLFIEELTKTVLESDSPDASANDRHVIPMTLRDILTARFDRVGGAKDVAQLGAAIGRRFTLDMLRAITKRDAPSLQADLEILEKAGLITSRTQERDVEYRFRHSLIRETAYDSSLRARNKAMHGDIARVIEEQFATIAQDDPVALAHHWERAENFAKAVHYLQQAAARALAQYANVETIHHARRALALLDKAAAGGLPAFELHLLLGQASYVVEGPAAQSTVEAYNRAQDLAEEVADSDQRCALLYGIFSGYHFAARFDLARGPAARIMELAEKENSDWLRCQAHRMLGYIDFFTGDCKAADAHFVALDKLYQPRAFGALAPRFGADCLVGARGFHALILCLRGEPEAAARMSRETLDYALSLGHPATTGWAYAAACYLAFFLGDRETGRRLAVAGERYCRENNIGAWRVHCRVFDIWAGFSAAADAPEAEREMRALVGEAAKGTLLGIPMLRGVLVDLLLTVGRPEDALRETDAALAEIASTGQYFFEPSLLALRAACLDRCGTGDQNAVRAAFECATEAARRRHLPGIASNIVGSRHLPTIP